MIYHGNNQVTAVYLGETRITSIYKGSEAILAGITTYSVTTNLTNITSDAPASVEKDDPLHVTLLVNTGLIIDDSSVTVTMGGVDITSTAYDQNDKTITIAEVTGNVSITADTIYDAEVEWIEATGTQFIDTGIVLTKTYEIEADVAFTAINGYSVFIGAYTSTSIYSHPLAFSNAGRPYTQVGNANSYVYLITSGSYADSVFRHYICSGNGSTQYIKVGTTTKSKTISGSISSATMYIFANHIEAATGFAKARTSGLSIKVGGTLVRDYISVRKGQTGYLYDKVSKTLFGNGGQDDFIVGTDK